MGRAKKKYYKGLKADQQHLAIRKIAKKREEKLLKPGYFNVYYVDNWLTGFRKCE